MIKILKKTFSKNKADEFSKVPEGYCPNCWGYQEYGDTIRDMYYDQQISVNNHDPAAKYTFIQDFVVTNLKGIKLRGHVNGSVCPTCSVVHKKGYANE